MLIFGNYEKEMIKGGNVSSINQAPPEVHVGATVLQDSDFNNVDENLSTIVALFQQLLHPI